MRPLAVCAVVVVGGLLAALAAGCARPVDDGRYVTKAAGTIEEVPWTDVHMDFAKLAQPGSLTFVELSGVHCGGCRKNAKLFQKLAKVRPDISVRIVQFPDEVCADPRSPACREAVRETKEGGGCFTPTLYAFAPDGKLLAKDDTCRDARPGAELFHELADRELEKAL